MIAIVNYGSGNIKALGNIYGTLGVPFVVAEHPHELAGAERIILPGVGAFDQAMNELERSGMRRALETAVMTERKPILGICVGMQLLAHTSEEGTVRGLSWIDGAVKKFHRLPADGAAYLPHMGWNTVELTRGSPLFAGVDLSTGYYFLHSYFFSCSDIRSALGVTEYGVPFTSVVNVANIYGVQFHPEKSHHAGVQLLKNFATLPLEQLAC